MKTAAEVPENVSDKLRTGARQMIRRTCNSEASKDANTKHAHISPPSNLLDLQQGSFGLKWRLAWGTESFHDGLKWRITWGMMWEASVCSKGGSNKG